MSAWGLGAPSSDFELSQTRIVVIRAWPSHMLQNETSVVLHEVNPVEVSNSHCNCM